LSETNAFVDRMFPGSLRVVWWWCPTSVWPSNENIQTFKLQKELVKILLRKIK